MSNITTIRTNTAGEPYLTETPAEGFVHIAYHSFSTSDLDGTQDSLYATEERHMVNGINRLYGTALNWGDIEGKTITFFSRNSPSYPFQQYEFQKLGQFYIAKVIKGYPVLLGGGTIRNVADYTAADLDGDGDDVVLYATKKQSRDVGRFLQNNFTTHPLKLNPARDIDFTLMLSADEETLKTVILRCFPAQDDMIAIFIKSGGIDAEEIQVNKNSRDSIVVSINNDNPPADITRDNFTRPDEIRMYDPIAGVDKKSNVYQVTRGENVKYLLVYEKDEDTPKPPVS